MSAKINYDAVRKSIREVCTQSGYDDNSAGPVFVRLGWHASGTYAPGLIPGSASSGGSNGADPSNAGLTHAVSFLEPVKKKHPQISYADLFTLASVEAIAVMGGPIVAWQPGREDFNGASSDYRDDITGRLPDGAQGASHVRDIFYRMGFNDQEIVALSGAHSVGRCHADRSGFDGPWTTNPTRFSNMYFKLLLKKDWKVRNWDGPKQYEAKVAGMSLMMLESDMALVSDPAFLKYTKRYAESQDEFFKDFAAAFAKLLELGIQRDASGIAKLAKKIKELEGKTQSDVLKCLRSKL